MVTISRMFHSFVIILVVILFFSNDNNNNNNMYIYIYICYVMFLYSIIWDERLIPELRNCDPMNYDAPEPEKVEQVEIEHIQKFFVNYILSDKLGQIANAHLAQAD